MYVLPRALLSLGCAVALLGLPSSLASAGQIRAVSCANDVVVLGADLDPAGRAEVLARLGASSPRAATYLVESIADERAQALGLVPARLLGLVAISSARLTRRPASEGLTVRTDPTITLDTARLYANALVTAGIRHAFVSVTAPAATPALGTTALLGLLRAARAVCLNVPADRAALAIRELVLTSHVAAAYGAAPAAALLDEAKRSAAALSEPDATALASVVDRAASDAGTPLRPVTRAALSSLLADMAAARHRVAGAGLSAVRGIPPYLAEVAPPPAASPPPATPVPASRQRPTVLAGAAVSVAGGALTGMFSGRTRTLGHVMGQLVVTRNGVPAHLEDVQRGDRVTVHLDASGRMVRLAARGQTVPQPTARAASTPAPVVAALAEQGVVTANRAGELTYTTTLSAAVHARSGVTVTRNGRPATFADIRPGDRVTIYRASDQAVRVEARGPGDAGTVLRGTLISASGARVVLYGAGAASTARTVALAGAAAISRDGRVGLAPAALHPGDAVTVTLDADGAASAVQAHAPAPLRHAATSALDVSSALLPALAVLVGTLLLLALFLWVLRRRPLPFVIVERRPGPTDDAAPPAPFKLLRDARVLCLDGEEGRVVHAVVDPVTGALVRLIVRDRSGALREVPAHLITALDVTLVRLDIEWPALQTLVQQRPTFSPRRYKRLPSERRRHTDRGVAILSSPQTLHVETNIDDAGLPATS